MMTRSFLVLLALLMLVPFATPAAPATCTDPCTVSARSAGYVLPVVTIASGQSIVFSSADVGHNTADGTGVGGGGNCFGVASSPGSDAPPVTLTIVGASLVASYQDSDGRGHSGACASATALPSGGFVVPFYCKLHTNMRGSIVVS